VWYCVLGSRLIAVLFSSNHHVVSYVLTYHYARHHRLLPHCTETQIMRSSSTLLSSSDISLHERQDDHHAESDIKAVDEVTYAPVTVILVTFNLISASSHYTLRLRIHVTPPPTLMLLLSVAHFVVDVEYM
jgi:hypothetical protein